MVKPRPPRFPQKKSHQENPAPAQILFATPSPLAAAFGLSVLGFGFHATKQKRTFDAMKPWSLPFWSINWVSKGGGWFENGPIGRRRVRRGEALVRFPHEPCRYGHSPGDAWDEYWILFDGNLPARLVEAGLLDAHSPILRPRGIDFTPRFEEARRASLLRRPPMAIFTRLLIDLFFHGLPAPGRPEKPDRPETDALKQFYELLHARAEEPLEGLPGLAAPFGNYHSLRRAFQKRYGRAPHQVLLEAKLLRARQRLLTTREPLTQIAHRVGIEDVSYFIRLFRKRFALSPVRFRRGVEAGP